MNLPETFLSQTKAILQDDFDSLIQAIDEESPTSIRYNINKYLPTPTDDIHELPVPWASNAFYLKKRPSFTLDPLFHAGCYYVQEASSMFLEQFVRTYINEPVKCLDLCAAPGGKSTHLSSILPEGSLLVANEVIRSRSHILCENLIKWGSPYSIVTNNDPKNIGNSLSGFFDLIVADVPCSGEGMFRKDKNAITEWSLANVNLCAERQRRIIADIWPALKPGGILIYSTCTFNPEENEENIHWIKTTFEAEPLNIETQPDWNITRSKRYDYPVFRFIPGKTKGEGFFIAAIRKPESAFSKNFSGKQKKNKKSSDKTIIPSGTKDWIRNADLFATKINNNVVLEIPKTIESDYLQIANFLHVIHAGIKLGEIKGRDVIPDHSLAMSVFMNRDIFPSTAIDKETAIKYLRREAIQLSPETRKGFLLLTYQDHPIGFVKNLGNRANNLYPQEWRIRF